MSYGRGRGRPTRQSQFIPDDGFVTINVDSMRETLSAYMAQQMPGTLLSHALKDLIVMGLATSPEHAAIHLERRRAHQEAQRFTYRALAAAFSQILSDLENTSITLENNYFNFQDYPPEEK